MNRRDVLSAAGTSLLGLGTVGAAAGSGRAQVQEPSIIFRDQNTDGTTLSVGRVATDVDAQFRILDSESNSIAGPFEFDAGTVVADYTVALAPPLTETETVSANLYDSDGQGIAREQAELHVDDPVDVTDGIGPTFIEAEPAAGFNYPYFLYAPTRPADEQPASILVQPNNSGRATDDFAVQKQSAENRIESGVSRTIADKLTVPLLVPVFPRPKTEPVDWRHYVHALDRQTIQISGGPVERVDLQLLRMADSAREKLAGQSYPVDDQLMLNGFSAAGNFVDRFTFLHPDRVRSVTAGGLNGTAMLPIEEADNHRLAFHIGIADIEELTGESVELDALDETNQLLYMGEDDGNDTIPYDDAWSDEMREIALDVYGEDMVADRFPTCQRAYEQAGVDAQFKVYEGTGHSPRSAVNDIVEFHRRSLNDEDVSEFGQKLGLRPQFEYTPDQPSPGDEIGFDANASALGVGDILAYTWQFADEETAAGQTPSHQFTDPGEYSVTLRAVDSKGRTATTTATVSVGKQHASTTTTVTESSTQSETTPAPTTDAQRSTTDQQADGGSITSGTAPAETSDGSAPGFGIGATVAGIGGAVYALTRRNGDESE